MVSDVDWLTDKSGARKRQVPIISLEAAEEALEAQELNDRRRRGITLNKKS